MNPGRVQLTIVEIVAGDQSNVSMTAFIEGRKLYVRTNARGDTTNDSGDVHCFSQVVLPWKQWYHLGIVHERRRMGKCCDQLYVHKYLSFL